MSKLDGNGRWQSKMTLTEHVEQYEANRHKTSNRPTAEEYTMARDYILLPHMLTMVERSMEEIKASKNILQRLYLTASRAVMHQIHTDMYSMRRELSKRNIKVVRDEQIDLVIYYKLICRGYEERFGIVRDVVRSEISVRLARYINNVAKLLEQKRE